MVLKRVRWGLIALALVLAGGTAGYVVLGFAPLDALYQTVTTVTTVGFREVEPLDAAGKLFTMVLILTGVGTVLYTFSVLLEAVVEGHVGNLFGRRRMQRKIDQMSGHVIVCGWGRVGRAFAQHVTASGQDVVVVDCDASRADDCPFPTVLGDATDDEVLRAAGIERARVFVAALSNDAASLYVTVSARSLRSDLFVIARARTEPSEHKLLRAGADRVVNPQRLGGQRMAAFALQPNVAEFLDVVMHDGTLEFRLEELLVPGGSPLSGVTLRESHIRDRTGALVLAIRKERFETNPAPDTLIEPGNVLITIGTTSQLEALRSLAGA
jgi:voltage-gated potassium channel